MLNGGGAGSEIVGRNSSSGVSSFDYTDPPSTASPFEDTSLQSISSAAVLELIVLRERDITAISSPLAEEHRPSLAKFRRSCFIGSCGSSREVKPAAGTKPRFINDTGRGNGTFRDRRDVNAFAVNGDETKPAWRTFRITATRFPLLNGTYRGHFKTAKIPDKGKLFFDRNFRNGRRRQPQASISRPRERQVSQGYFSVNHRVSQYPIRVLCKFDRNSRRISSVVSM